MKHEVEREIENVMNEGLNLLLLIQYGKPAHDMMNEGDPPQEQSQRGTSPQEGTFHFASRFTWERTKTAKSDNVNDVYEYEDVSSLQTMHQFIEISRSICALENKINSNILMSSDPWKSVCQRVFPCTAAETIGRTN